MSFITFLSGKMELLFIRKELQAGMQPCNPRDRNMYLLNNMQ
jgi:hypothetical protein